MNEKRKTCNIRINNEAVFKRLNLLRKHYKDEDPSTVGNGKGKRPLATYTYVIAMMFERNDILGIEVKQLKREIVSLKEQIAFFKR